MSELTQSKSWQALEKHFPSISSMHMRDMFAKDPERFSKFSLECCGIFLDYSKNRVNRQTMDLLLDLAGEVQVEQKISDMFAGEKINVTEKRSVLHTALRNRSPRPVMVDGTDVMPDVRNVLEKMRGFTQKVRQGDWKGFTGKPVTDVVNIGIGGSDLGPRMAVRALEGYTSRELKVRFVSNVDPAHLENTLAGLNPETTLFIIASKSFTTQETMFNAQQARQWFLRHARDEKHVCAHFAAVSTNTDRVSQFGIDPDNMFEFWDWVGGRFSLWSAIGLPIALAIGMDGFEKLLQGAWRMDEHFRTAPLGRNMPVILAMLGIWYRNFFNTCSQALLPYSQYLEEFPAYMQQAEMESNGKSVTLNNQKVDYHTSPVLWGEPGTNGQHAFFQLLHQGTDIIPADFIIFARQPGHDPKQHRLLMANFFAQTEALMKGRTEEETRRELSSQNLSGRNLDSLVQHKVFAGNKPSTSILIDELTPERLGSLIALYEHKIFVQGVVWNINSFDQWGVELGKKLAKAIEPQLVDNTPVQDHDSSTSGLINKWKEMS